MNETWIARGKESEKGVVNLVLFTYAGGSPSLFAPWKRFFDAKINVFPVLYPGREARRREPVPATVEELAQQFVTENEDIFQKEFVFFGHCTGNLIAYQTASEVFRKYHKMPLCCIVSGSDSPAKKISDKILKNADETEVSDEVLAKRMIELGMVEESFLKDKNFIHYYVPIYRGDIQMLSSYEHSASFVYDCPLHILSGTKDTYITREGQKDWARYSTKEVTYEQVPGNHFFINTDREGTVKRINDYILGHIKSSYITGDYNGKEI